MASDLQSITIEPPNAANASVIWLHGLGADGHDFEPIVPELHLANDHGVRFIFPHAPIRPISINGGMEMRAWYDIADMGLDRKVDEDGIRDSAQAVESLIDKEQSSGIDSTRIILAGFSQGGAIALHLGLRFASRLAGILALSTYLPLAESLGSEASDAQQQLKIFVGHGIHDPMVPEKLGQRTAQTLSSAGYAVEYKSYPMAHSVCAEEIRDVSQWMQARLA
ncbi:MAG: alpha/beta fold hydrolase [Gammaproteobacteria bacterium]